MAKATINDQIINYEIQGVSDFRLRTPALLLHGNGESMKIFSSFVPLLSSSRGFVLMDSRYQGESEPLLEEAPVKIGYELMADDAVKLMEEELNIPEYDIIGSSDGAIVAILMALRSIRVRKLVLIGVNTDPAGLKPRMLRTIKRELRSAERKRDRVRAALCRMMLTEPHISNAELASLICETTVVYGQKDEAIRREHASAIADAIPRGSFVEVKNAPHGVASSNPGELAELVRSLI